MVLLPVQSATARLPISNVSASGLVRLSIGWAAVLALMLMTLAKTALPRDCPARSSARLLWASAAGATRLHSAGPEPYTRAQARFTATCPGFPDSTGSGRAPRNKSTSGLLIRISLLASRFLLSIKVSPQTPGTPVLGEVDQLLV